MPPRIYYNGDIDYKHYSTFIDMTGWQMWEHGIPDSRVRVIDVAYRKNYNTFWHCECSCGKKFISDGIRIRNGNCKSCGCFSSEQKSIRKSKEDMTGWKMWEHGVPDSRLEVVSSISYKDKEKYGISPKNRAKYWICKCTCGNTVITTTYKLKSGHTKSCGCYKSDVVSDRSHIDISGNRYGFLTAVEYCGESNWKCVCDCGKTTVARYGCLVGGYTKSCGCKQRTSISEVEISKILDANGTNYERQYKFDGCRSKRSNRFLPFDFAVMDENNSPKYLIEYDGEQHFRPVRLFGGDEKFHRQKEYDETKNEFCNNAGIPLIRIPYTKKGDITMDDLSIDTSRYVYSADDMRGGE